MNKTQSNQFIEDVRGIIIGDVYSTGQLFNENRPQGPRFNGVTDAEIREQALAYIEKLRAELGSEYRRLYPAGMELRYVSQSERS